MLSHKDQGNEEVFGRKWSRWKWPSLVFGLSLLLSGALTWSAWAGSKARDESRFENAVQRTGASIVARVDLYIGMLRAGAGLFAATTEVTQEDFRSFAQRINLPTFYPGVQGIGYAHRMLPEERSAFVDKMRRTGAAEFEISPPGDRPEFFPIVFLEPLDRRNRNAVGYDMFSEPTRNAAMARARDEARAAATARVLLVQEIDREKQAGFLIYVPVYQGGVLPDTVAARRERLEGFVYSPFRVDDLLAGIFGGETTPRVHFEIFDGDDAVPDQLLYRSPEASATAPVFGRTATLQIADRNWTVRYRSTPAFEASVTRSLVRWVALAGLLVSGALGGIAAALTRAVAKSQDRGRALADRSEQLRVTLASIGDAVISTDADGRVLFMNPVAEKITGWTASGARGQPLQVIAPMVNEDTNERVINPVELVLRDGVTVGLANHTVLLSKTGARIPIEDSAAPIRTDDGHMRGVVLVFRDVTETRRSEQSLRERERLLAAVASGASVGLAIVNANYEYNFANEAYSGVLDLEEQNVVGRRVPDVVKPGWSTIQPHLDRALAGEQVSYELVLPAVPLGNAARRTFAVKYEPQGDAQHRTVVVVVLDITERRRADEALRESEARKDAILRSALDAIITISHESTVMEFNPAAEALFGYAQNEVLGRSLAELIIPMRYRERHHHGMQRYLATGEGPVLRRRVELPAQRADGSEFPAEVAILPVPGFDPPIFTAFLRDITERNRAEEALRESEERFRATFENAAMGFALVDANGRFSRVNRAAATIIGYAPEELVTKTFEEITHPATRDADRAAARQLLAGEIPTYATEKRYVRKDGSMVWVYVTVSLLRNQAGGPVNFITTIEHIEQRKEAEERLQLSEERQRLAAEAANLGTWDFNPITRAVHCDARCRQLMGAPPDVAMSYEHFVALLHPGDRKRVVKIANATLRPQSGGHCDVEFRIIDLRDNAEKWMRAIGQAYFEPAPVSGEEKPENFARATTPAWRGRNGRDHAAAAGAARRAYRFIGTVQDITENKRKEHTRRFLEDLTAATQRLVSPQEVMQETARSLGEYLGVNRCAYAEVEREAVFVITGDYNRGVGSIVGRWPVAAFGSECTRLMLANKAYVVADSEADPRIGVADLAAYRATAIRAVICVPLHKAGKFTAAMAVHQASPREWTGEEITLVATVAARCWEALERGGAIRDLRESEQRFRFMAESMPQKIFTARPDGTVDYCNRQWLQFAGRPFEQIGGWGWAEMVHPDDRDETVRRWKHALRAGEMFELEQRFLRHDGTIRWHLSRAVPMRNEDGTVSMWIGSNTDITDIIEAREILTQRGEELERIVGERTASLREAVEQMEEFSYSVAHDLRSPLRSMHGYAQALLDDYRDKLDDTGQEYLRRIISASGRMDRLTLDILSYSKVSRASVELQRVSLDRLASECVTQFVNLPQKAEIVIERPLHDVMGHEPLLMQVVSNLIGNAVKFVASGTTPRVNVRTQKREDEVSLWIEDNGIGIAPDHQERIWGVFERAHVRAGYEGTGIGLAIVRKAVERMGGKIGVESDGRTGSKFWITLAAPTTPESE